MSHASWSALCYLAAWQRGLPIRDGLAFEPLLRRIRLDWSIESLARIDTFLDALRTAKKPQPEPFLKEYANQNLLVLLAFYVGELIGRSLGVPPQWIAPDGSAETETLPFGPGFDNSILCRFPGAKNSIDLFAPLAAICTRLFDGPDKSVVFSAGLLLPPDAPRGPLPPIPPPRPLDPQQALARCTAAERIALAMRKPDWAFDDPLARFFREAPAVLQKGRVVWAGLIQANGVLFQPGPEAGAPGELVYDPDGRAPPEALEAVGGALLRMKGKALDDPAQQAFSDYLAAETTRAFGIDVPPAVTPYPLKVATTFFDRNYLPERVIAKASFPVLVSDTHPGIVLFLPACTWPADLRAHWKG